MPNATQDQLDRIEESIFKLRLNLRLKEQLNRIEATLDEILQLQDDALKKEVDSVTQTLRGQIDELQTDIATTPKG